MSAHIHHIAISVQDPKKSRQFYDPLFKALEGEAGMVSERLCTWSAGSVELLAYVIEVPDSPHVFGAAGWQHLALAVESTEFVDSVAVVAREHGQIVHEPREYPEYWPGYYAVFFEDPDRVRWEVMFPAEGHKP